MHLRGTILTTLSQRVHVYVLRYDIVNIALCLSLDDSSIVLAPPPSQHPNVVMPWWQIPLQLMGEVNKVSWCSLYFQILGEFLVDSLEFFSWIGTLSSSLNFLS